MSFSHAKYFEKGMVVGEMGEMGQQGGTHLEKVAYLESNGDSAKKLGLVYNVANGFDELILEVQVVRSTPMG